MINIVAKARQVTAKAISLGALHTLSTQVESISEQEFAFTLRIASSLRKKNATPRGKDGGRNPFLPYEEELYVADLGAKHVCILNKYNVLPEHLLIITREFESQESELTQEDFSALMMIMGGSGGLGFFNGGEMAGASQPHKHLQWVSAEPEQFPLLAQPSLPFIHGDRDYRTGDAGSCYQAYLALRSQFDWQPGQPFNLLITPTLVRWIPRTQAAVANISINSLGFAGSFFVPDREHAETLCAAGLMKALCLVSGAEEGLSPD
jgi:ATP adenylyltransferase (5'',5''''''-P-1,P-4-tetraphosphate phosphorylase II)